MDDLSARSVPQLILDLMMESLRVRDERLNAIAVELLVEFGIQPVRRLVLEASAQRTRRPTASGH